MFMKTLGYFTLPLLLLLSNSSGNSAQSLAKSSQGEAGTLEKMIVTNGNVAFDLDLNQLNATSSSGQESNQETLRFQVSPNSFFTALVYDNLLRDLEAGTIGLISQNTANLPQSLAASLHQLVLEKRQSDEAFELVIRDGKTNLAFFKIDGAEYDYSAAARSLSINGRLLLSEDFAKQLRLPWETPRVVGKISVTASLQSIEVKTIVNGEVQSAVLPALHGGGEPGTNLGPDVIVGNISDVQAGGTVNGQVGVSVGTDSCNAGTIDLDWFALPSNDHPVIPQNVYRMSGGPNNTDRFEQIGQSWLKHAFTAASSNSCGFGCNGVGGAHLGSGCSDLYSAGLNAGQSGLGSRAWVNPFTGVYPNGSSSTPPNNHSGHAHNATSHRALVNVSDLDPNQNAGATYYFEGQYVTPHEYVWCQANPGQCNMYNNASYRRFNVSGTTSFTFSPVGSTARMSPAINAWTGATINPIEPDPGRDGRAFIAYKVTNPSAGVWHYEYALYNQNLDRAIQSFNVPLGSGVTVNNIGFHTPLNHPGFANDGTQGDQGYSNTAWTSNQTLGAMTWSSQTFAENPNANVLRWGTLYNFRFDSNRPPQATTATVGFFKTGTPVTVSIQGPSPNNTTSRCPECSRER
jgi:hypothetical protein